MRRVKSLAMLLCAGAGSLSVLAPPAIPQTVQSVAATAGGSVCIVLAGGGNGATSGTGFVVADGFVLTAHHVVQHAEHLRVLCPDHPAIEVKVVNADTDNDVAVVQNPLLTIRPLPLGDSGRVQVGQEIVVIGFPRADLLGAETATMTQGIVSAVRGAALQIQAPVGPGNSGSPVLTLQGQVVGVVRAVQGSQVGSNFATSFATAIDAAKPFLTSLPGLTPKGGPFCKPFCLGGPSVPQTPKPASTSSSFVITPGRGIGDLQLGMSQGQLEALLGPVKNVWQKPNAEISFHGGVNINWFDCPRGPQDVCRGLFVVVSSGGAEMIGVLNDPRYAIPAQGLHHGSTESEVRAALGEPSRVETIPNHKLLDYDSLGLRFAIVTNRSWGIYGLVHMIAIYRPT